MFVELLRIEIERRWRGLLLLLLVTMGGPALHLRLAERMGIDRPLSDWVMPLRDVNAAAVLLGLAVPITTFLWGVRTWAVEREARWSYTLTLPVRREKLVGMRWAAGVAWLLLVLAGAGSMAATALWRADLPAGLHGYLCAWMATLVGVSLTAYSTGFVLPLLSRRTRRTLALTAAAVLVLWAMTLNPPQIPWSFRLVVIPLLLTGAATGLPSLIDF